MNWNRTTISFLILRKNSRLLKEYIYHDCDDKVRSHRRQYIIGIKEELASLTSERYNLIKTIATEIDRFSIKSIVSNYIETHSDDFHKVQYVIQDTNIVIREEIVPHFLMGRLWMGSTGESPKDTMRGQPASEDPWILYDKIHNIHFLIYDDKTVVDNVDLFIGKEHAWFICIFKALEEMKTAEEEIMKQQRILEELRIEEQRKAGILSKYL